MIKITPYELLEEIRTTNNPKRTIQLLNELLAELERDPKRYILKLSEEIEEFANAFERCPLCGHKITVTEYKEDRGECRGFNSQETMYRRECSSPECSYSVE